jgi:hypothetical protein
MSAINVTKHGRFWAVRDTAGELVCLCVYKRGAAEVARRLRASGPAALALQESAPPPASGVGISLETLGHSPRATLASLMIRTDQAQQQQNGKDSTP